MIDIEQKFWLKRTPNIIFKVQHLQYFRWKRVCTEEDISKMGEFSFDSNELSNSGPLHRPSRWKDADETTGNSVWGETGMETSATVYIVSLALDKTDEGFPIVCYWFFAYYVLVYIDQW